MAGAYTSIRIHLVWGTGRRRPWLDPAWRPRLFAHLGAAASGRGAELLCAGGARDHVHLYVHCPGTLALADLVGTLKTGSARWIQQTFPHRRDFRWQEGWGAFSVARTAESALQDYIRHQEVHHRKMSFSSEYVALLAQHGVDYDLRDVLE